MRTGTATQQDGAARAALTAQVRLVAAVAATQVGPVDATRKRAPQGGEAAVALEEQEAQAVQVTRGVTWRHCRATARPEGRRVVQADEPVQAVRMAVAQVVRAAAVLAAESAPTDRRHSAATVPVARVAPGRAVAAQARTAPVVPAGRAARVVQAAAAPATVPGSGRTDMVPAAMVPAA